eukprot:17838-Pelagomonas_calceolata.AAC.3
MMQTKRKANNSIHEAEMFAQTLALTPTFRSIQTHATNSHARVRHMNAARTHTASSGRAQAADVVACPPPSEAPPAGSAELLQGCALLLL